MRETKKYCDICKKEIFHTEGWNLRMCPSWSFRTEGRITLDDLCEEHSTMIYDFVKNIIERDSK